MLQHDLQHIRYFAQLKHYWNINSQTQLIGYPKISRFLTFIKCQKSCFRFILNKKKGPNVSSSQCIQGTSSVCKRISTLQCIQGTLSIWRGISALQCIQGTTSEIFSKGVENGDFMGLEKVSLKCGSQGQAGTPTKVKLWGNTTLVCLMLTSLDDLEAGYVNFLAHECSSVHFSLSRLEDQPKRLKNLTFYYSIISLQQGNRTCLAFLNM